MNIALVGYRCSGKTTVSRRLAALGGWERVESDRLVEQRLGRSIPEIVRHLGWGVFRAAEEAVVSEHLQGDRVILDLGGGVITNRRLVERLERSAFVVFLDCPAEVLLARSRASYQRPALTALAPEEELLATLAERLPLYRSCADLVVDATRSPGEVAARILAALPRARRRSAVAKEVKG